MGDLSLLHFSPHSTLASFKACRVAAENLAEELAIPVKLGDKWTVEELNTVLKNNLVGSGSGGHLRTFGAIQWECELYRGRPKARCYPFNLDGHRFRGKNPQVKSWLCYLLNNMLYNML